MEVLSKLEWWIYISKDAFWFPRVSQPGQPMKTSENLGTWEPGHPCPISRKPHKFIWRENLGNPRVLVKLFIDCCGYKFNILINSNTRLTKPVGKLRQR
jgi:hypothetical protein